VRSLNTSPDDLARLLGSGRTVEELRSCRAEPAEWMLILRLLAAGMLEADTCTVLR
jgi:hypothetical protein